MSDVKPVESAPNVATQPDAIVSREEFQRMLQDLPPWYKDAKRLKLYLLLIAPLLTSTATGFDISMSNGFQSVEYFMENFGHPSGSTLGFYGASMSIGGLVGAVLGSKMSDWFGRRVMVVVGAAIIFGSAFMQTFAPTFAVFVAGKLILGIGSALQQMSAPILVTELAHPKERITVSSFYNTNIFLGLIIGSWITFGTHTIPSQWSWKLPCILQAAIPSYQIVMTWFCPESPRWLMVRGRIQEAQDILVRYHGSTDMGADDPVVHTEMQEILAGIEADKTQIRFNKEGLKSIFGSKGNRHRLFIAMIVAIGSQTLGSNFISVYLPLIMDQIGMTSSKEKTLMNAIMSILNWLTALVCVATIHRMRRRLLFLTSLGGMTGAFIVWMALTAQYVESLQPAYGKGVLAMIFVFNVFSAICWIPMVIAYPLECITTKQRGVFFAFVFFCISGSSSVATYIGPPMLEALGWKTYVIQICYNAVTWVIIFFTFVETKGMTLEEVAGIFDGFDSLDSAQAVAQDKLRQVEKQAAQLEEVDHMEGGAAK
jgi:sugar porter (SP) family MFS transporter